MSVSEEDLQKQRDKLEKMREQLAEAETQRVTRETDLSREIEMKKMQAEESRLQGELNLAKEMAKATNVKAGVSDLLDTVKDQEAAASEQAKAAASAAGKE